MAGLDGSIYVTSHSRDPYIGEGIFEKIISFSRLAYGWRYGEGAPIPVGTIRTAFQWASQLSSLGFVDVDAFAGVGGEVSLIGNRGVHCVEVIVEANGFLSVGHDITGHQVTYHPNLRALEATKIINDIARGIWSISGFYIPETSIDEGIDSPALHCAIYREASPLLTPIVSKERAPDSVTIYDDTTQASQGSLQSFGGLTHQFYLSRTG